MLTDIIQYLQSTLPDLDIITPDSKHYSTAIQRWAANVEQKGAIVVYPASPADISTVIQACVAHHIRFTVAGGGHSVNGDSSLEDGLVIDLRRMREVQVLTPQQGQFEETTILVQGGARVIDVENHCWPYGVTTPLGSCSQVGVAGFALGGGLSFLNGQHGLALDNLLAVDMVLADGRIVRASATESPDLFWAVRGAGPAFGVATQLTFQAHKQRSHVWAGVLAFEATEILTRLVLRFSRDLQQDSPDGRSCIHVYLSFPPQLEGRLALACTVFHNGPANEAQEIFAPLLNASPLLNTVDMVPYPAVCAFFDHRLGPGNRHLYKGESLDFSADEGEDLFRGLCQRLRTLLEICPDATRSFAMCDFSSTRVMQAVPSDAMAYNNRSSYANVLVKAGWHDPQNDAVCEQWLRDTDVWLQQRMHGKGKGQGVGFYASYDGLGTPAAKVFGSHYQRLVELKTKYDPTNQFLRAHGLRSGLSQSSLDGHK